MLQKNASGYNIPIFMSETGCNTPEPRTFDDQSAILGSEMSGTWSGAIIYEWIEEANNYGLISYGPPASTAAVSASEVVGGYTRGGTPTPIEPDFSNLSGQWATLNPSGISMNAYTPSETPPPCPAYTSGMWEVSGNVPLPTIGAKGTTYKAAAAVTTQSTSASSTTSASSAASATRGASLGLSRRSGGRLVGRLCKAAKAHQLLFCAVVVFAGFLVLAVGL